MTRKPDNLPKVSVIIPSFRPGDYITECLDSVINQTLSKNDYEIIIVLNGEKEPYLSMIKNIIIGHNNITVKYTSLAGVSNARNIGLDNARGEYITFIDDDDYVSPHYLEALLKSVNNLHEGAIVCSDVRTFDENSNIGEDYISHAFKKAVQTPQNNSIFKRRSFLSSSCCKLIPIKIIANRRFNPNVKLTEDALFMALISDKINTVLTSSEHAVYYRRLRSESASRSNEKFFNKLCRKFSMIKLFTSIYIKGFPHYNFTFFLSRIIAVSIK